MHTIALIQMADFASFAPAQVGSLVYIDFDESNRSGIWYQKQYRDEKQNHVVWRRIKEPQDAWLILEEYQNQLADGLGHDLRYWKESELDDRIAQAEQMRPVKVVREWVDEI